MGKRKASSKNNHSSIRTNEPSSKKKIGGHINMKMTSSDHDNASSSSENSKERLSTRLSFTTPEGLLATLLSPATSVQSFLADYWEKRPLIVHKGGILGAAGCYGIEFTKETLLETLKAHKINFERDINVCRYVDSTRQNLNGTGRATAAKIQHLFNKERATLQFHQPQRFQDDFWCICDNLESYFSSLVGANIYITPGGSQGLAPHYDDVEVIILQLAGRKHWRLYTPPTELPRDYSRDLNQDDIGTPTHDFVLETGDVLYFPRGTVHQADTPTDCPYSVHITLSTYQRSSYGDILGIAISHILQSAIKDNVDLRRGLPLNFLTNKETGNETVTHLLSQLSNHIGGHIKQAADWMMCDFVANRLPPFGHEASDPIGPMPTDSCRVKLTFPRHTFVVLKTKQGTKHDEDEDDEDENEDDEDNEDEVNDVESDETNSVIVCHSIRNSRKDHMMNPIPVEPQGLQFHANHHRALTQLKMSTDWLDSKDLDLPQSDVKHLLTALWAEGLLEVYKQD